MKLPRKDKTVLDYTRTIGLTRFKPLGRNIIVGFGSFAILCLSLFIGSKILKTPIFPLNFLFSAPNIMNPGMLFLGWFIWIYMIRPGLWEEVAFRGVVIPMLSKRYNQYLQNG